MKSLIYSLIISLGCTISYAQTVESSKRQTKFAMEAGGSLAKPRIAAMNTAALFPIGKSSYLGLESGVFQIEDSYVRQSGISFSLGSYLSVVGDSKTDFTAGFYQSFGLIIPWTGTYKDSINEIVTMPPQDLMISPKADFGLFLIFEEKIHAKLLLSVRRLNGIYPVDITAVRAQQLIAPTIRVGWSF